MTSGPPQPPHEPAHHIVNPHVAYPAGWPGGPMPPPVAPPKGIWLAIVAMVLGVLGCVLPLAPFDLTGVRPYLGVAFGLPGFVVGIIGFTGHRRGKGLAILGSILSVIALGLTAVMLVNSLRVLP